MHDRGWLRAMPDSRRGSNRAAALSKGGMGQDEQEQDPQRQPGAAPAVAPPDVRVLLIGPSLRILGGQAVMADQLLRCMRRDGLCVDFLPIDPKPPGPLALAERVKGLRTAVVSSFYLASLLARVRRYDVVHLFSASYLSFLIAQMPAILVARMVGKPVILNYRSGEAEDHLAHASRLVFALLRMCRCIVVPSRFLVDVFARFGFDAEAIPNTVDAKQFPHRVRTLLQTADRRTAHARDDLQRGLRAARLRAGSSPAAGCRDDRAGRRLAGAGAAPAGPRAGAAQSGLRWQGRAQPWGGSSTITTCC